MAGNERQVTLRIAAEDAWSQTMKDLKVALAMLPQDVLANMQKTNAAFAQLKVKSSLDIENQKAQLVSAFRDIKASGTASTADIERAYAGLKTRLSELNKQLEIERSRAAQSNRQGLQDLSRQADDTGKRVGGNISGINGALGVMAQYVVGAFSVRAISAFVKESLNAAFAMDAINSKLKVLTGSSQSAAREWQFVRAEAQRLGLDLQQTADSYSSFAVATQNTSMEGEAARRMFISVAEAATALHLPADKTTAVLYQFQQMLSKGKVNMEDLKTASESFPGLLKQVADALGVSTSQLMDQMQKGELMAADVLPKLADQLHKTYGIAATEAAGKGRSALNKLTSSVFELKSAFGEALTPATSKVLKIFDRMVFASKNLLSYVEIMGIGLGAAFDKVGVRMRALLNKDLFSEEGKARVKKALDDIDIAAGESFKNLEAKYGILNENLNQKNKDSADKDRVNNQRRRDEAKKTGEDLAKINEEYSKTISNDEALLSSVMEKEYQERLKVVKAFYNQKKAASTSDGEEIAWEQKKTAKLKALAEQHARDNEIITAQMIQSAVDRRKEGLDEEISAIRKQAADQIVTAEQAEQQITLLTVADARERYEARLYLATKIAEIYGRDSEAYKKALKEQQASHKSYTDANLSAYKAYGDKIKEIDRQIADFRKAIQEKIRDLAQRGMSDEQKYKDNLARFTEALDAAESARRQKKYDEALKYNKQAEDLAGRLADSQVQGVDGVKSATEALRKVEENRVKTLEEQKAQVQESQDKLKQISEQKLDPKKLEISLDEAALARVTEEIARLTTTETKKIYIETIGPSGDPNYTNYQVPGMATGGRVGGYGTGDNQLRLLDPREHVIRPEATAFWGDSFLAAVNAPWTAAGQRIAARIAAAALPSMPYVPTAPSFAMAKGGPVGVGTVDMGSVTINVGGGSYPVMAKVDVINELKTALRREALVRKQ